MERAGVPGEAGQAVARACCSQTERVGAACPWAPSQWGLVRTGTEPTSHQALELAGGEGYVHPQRSH